MCGRFFQYRSPQEYAEALGLAVPEGNLPNVPARYNGAPGQDFLVVRRHPDTGGAVLGSLRWGLVPSWAKDEKIAWRLINARAETVATTNAFRAAYRQRRCLVPADGFFEWKRLGPKEKQPYAVGMEDLEPFTMAGLWENWKAPDGEWLRTFAIVTTENNELLADLHDRMPVIVAPADRERWLAGDDPADLLRSPPSEGMAKWPVSTEVNSPRHNHPGLLQRVAA